MSEGLLTCLVDCNAPDGFAQDALESAGADGRGIATRDLQWLSRRWE